MTVTLHIHACFVTHCTMCITGCLLCFSVFCEQLEPLQQTKHSSSAVEVTTCFSQVHEIWHQLAWPDSAGAFIFITRLTDVSASSSVATHDADSHAYISILVLESKSHRKLRNSP